MAFKSSVGTMVDARSKSSRDKGYLGASRDIWIWALPVSSLSSLADTHGLWAECPIWACLVGRVTGPIPVALSHFPLLGCHPQNGPSCGKTRPSACLSGARVRVPGRASCPVVPTTALWGGSSRWCLPHGRAHSETKAAEGGRRAAGDEEGDGLWGSAAGWGSRGERDEAPWACGRGLKFCGHSGGRWGLWPP